MNNFFVSYRKLPYEQRVLLITTLGMCGSALLAVGKFTVGLFFNYNLCTIAVYTIALVLSKLECVKGAKSKKRKFATQNMLISLFLLFSSIIYTGFMCRNLIIPPKHHEYNLSYVCIIASISFFELGLSIFGIIKTKNKGFYYRNIKIINFCMAMIAILTTQVVILDFTGTKNVDTANAVAGMGIGIVIALLAVYILVAPKISLIDREHHAFTLNSESKNKIISLSETQASLPLCKSKIYGTYSFVATVDGKKVEGDIVLGAGIWKDMNIYLKILCCILSEILLPCWLIGRFIFFLRSANLPKKLEQLMLQNGFEKV